MSNLGSGGAADYTINRLGDKYVATPRHGFDYIKNTSLNQVWLDINSEVGRGPVVEFGASTDAVPFVVDASLEVEYSSTVIRGQSPGATVLKLGSAVDDDMIKNSGTTFYRNSRIERLTLDGNRANNTLGRGIEWDVANATGGNPPEFWEMLSVDKVLVTECDQEGIYIKTDDGVLATINLGDCRVWDCDGAATGGYQIYIERVFDSWIGGKKFMTSSMRLKTVSTSHIFDLYIAGGVNNLLQIDGGASDYNASGNIFTNCRIDNALGTAILLADYAYRNQFIGCTITNMSQSAATNTYPAIYADGNAYANRVVGCWIGHDKIVNTDRWTYAFEENIDSYTQILATGAGYGEVLSSGNVEHFTQNEYLLNGATTTIGTDCLKDNGVAWNA